MIASIRTAFNPNDHRQAKKVKEAKTMETLTIKSPADLLSFIGHTLGFWPQESLVCITVDTDRLGATLRVDLPRHDGGELGYARTVAGYLTHDPNATAVLFAVYTSTPWDAGQPKPRAAIIAALTGVLAERGISISDGLLVGEKTFTQYDGDPQHSAAIPLTATQTSAINAEFIYRGSSVDDTDRITLPNPTNDATQRAAVEDRMETIRTLPADEAVGQAQKALGRHAGRQKTTQPTTRSPFPDRKTSRPAERSLDKTSITPLVMQ
ncbi:DUF4192 family protein [Arthrobacter pascens]|uniref:DUF4192 family protein n=1 Tax=Arthrobacter pascens TaxID=1677 RepID=UPI0027DDD313|nr:DUF4192 family protein [Arthrobacter pascens]